uniref:Uncharacterized protein n=1 Tax=Cucumis sativus TaxID=3659 RepID=A0A0A0M033_CUCSA
MSPNSISRPQNLVVVENSIPFLPYDKPKPQPYNKYTNDYFTVFWFFISNTLIFIIAVDYGLFSLSQHKSFHLYEDYYYSPPNPKLTHFQLQTSSLVVFDEKRETPDEKLETVVQSQRLDSPSKNTTTPVRTYLRRKSEKPKRIVSMEISKKMMGKRRSESVKNEGKELEDENEFAKMTDEELNRRVEEFIQRFNKQMRLQTKLN